VLTARLAIILLNVLANDVFPFQYAYIHRITSRIILRPQKNVRRMEGIMAVKVPPVLPTVAFPSSFIEPRPTIPKC